MEKVKEKINNILATVISLIIIISSIIVGTPLKENTRIISYISIVIFFICMINYKFIQKKKFREIFKKINIIDTSVIILCLASLIPLFFKTYLDETATINTCIRYVTLLIIYTLSKILMLQNDKYKKYFINSLIISGIISVIIGIDNMTLGFFNEKLQELGIPKYFNNENRMIGNFGYANTYAISMLIPLILSIDKYLKNNKYKFIYLLFSFIFMTCFILTYSRASYIIMIIVIIIFCLLQKNKEKSIKMFNLILITTSTSLIYSKIFADYYNKNFSIIIITLIILCILSSIFITLLNKVNIEKKINFKKYIKYLILLIAVIVITILVGLKLTKPLKIFETETDKKIIQYKITNIDSSKKYNFKFDIKSLSKENLYIYSIEIVQRNINDIKLSSDYIRFGSYKGIKEIEITPDPSTYNFYIIFRSINTKYQLGLNIKSLKINEKEYALDYVYLPVKIINRINSFNLESLMKHGRVVFYKDALKLIKEKPLTGFGGDAWNLLYKDIRSYNYTATQVHSYPIQLFLEFGVIALIAYIVMIISIIIKIKKANQELYGVCISLLAIILHSAIDFDLSFMNMLIYMFILISIISTSTIKLEKRNYLDSCLKRIIDIVGSFIGIILLIPFTIGIFIAKIIFKDKGPLFYTQYRIGKNGKKFKLYKFRSMIINADEVLKDYLKNNKEIRKEYTECKKIQNDPRVTSIGKFIRKTNIDELPQFINVFKGDMSIVGPRPYLPQEKNDMENNYDILISCKPGITGNWQVNKGKDNTFKTRLKLDTDYIKSNSLLIDLIIIFKTLGLIKKGEKNNENIISK